MPPIQSPYSPIYKSGRNIYSGANSDDGTIVSRRDDEVFYPGMDPNDEYMLMVLNPEACIIGQPDDVMFQCVTKRIPGGDNYTTTKADGCLIIHTEAIRNTYVEVVEFDKDNEYSAEVTRRFNLSQNLGAAYDYGKLVASKVTVSLGGPPMVGYVVPGSTVGARVYSDLCDIVSTDESGSVYSKIGFGAIQSLNANYNDKVTPVNASSGICITPLLTNFGCQPVRLNDKLPTKFTTINPGIGNVRVTNGSGNLPSVVRCSGDIEQFNVPLLAEEQIVIDGPTCNFPGATGVFTGEINIDASFSMLVDPDNTGVVQVGVVFMPYDAADNNIVEENQTIWLDTMEIPYTDLDHGRRKSLSAKFNFPKPPPIGSVTASSIITKIVNQFKVQFIFRNQGPTVELTASGPFSIDFTIENGQYPGYSKPFTIIAWTGVTPGTNILLSYVLNTVATPNTNLQKEQTTNFMKPDMSFSSYLKLCKIADSLGHRNLWTYAACAEAMGRAPRLLIDKVYDFEGFKPAEEVAETAGKAKKFFNSVGHTLRREGAHITKAAAKEAKKLAKNTFNDVIRKYGPKVGETLIHAVENLVSDPATAVALMAGGMAAGGSAAGGSAAGGSCAPGTLIGVIKNKRGYIRDMLNNLPRTNSAVKDIAGELISLIRPDSKGIRKMSSKENLGLGEPSNFKNHQLYFSMAYAQMADDEEDFPDAGKVMLFVNGEAYFLCGFENHGEETLKCSGDENVYDTTDSGSFRGIGRNADTSNNYNSGDGNIIAALNNINNNIALLKMRIDRLERTHFDLLDMLRRVDDASVKNSHALRDLGRSHEHLVADTQQIQDDLNKMKNLASKSQRQVPGVKELLNTTLISPENLPKVYLSQGVEISTKNGVELTFNPQGNYEFTPDEKIIYNDFINSTARDNKDFKEHENFKNFRYSCVFNKKPNIIIPINGKNSVPIPSTRYFYACALAGMNVDRPKGAYAYRSTLAAKFWWHNRFHIVNMNNDFRTALITVFDRLQDLCMWDKIYELMSLSVDYNVSLNNLIAKGECSEKKQMQRTQDKNDRRKGVSRVVANNGGIYELTYDGYSAIAPYIVETETGIAKAGNLYVTTDVAMFQNSLSTGAVRGSEEQHLSMAPKNASIWQFLGYTSKNGVITVEVSQLLRPVSGRSIELALRAIMHARSRGRPLKRLCWFTGVVGDKTDVNKLLYMPQNIAKAKILGFEALAQHNLNYILGSGGEVPEVHMFLKTMFDTNELNNKLVKAGLGTIECVQSLKEIYDMIDMSNTATTEFPIGNAFLEVKSDGHGIIVTKKKTQGKCSDLETDHRWGDDDVDSIDFNGAEASFSNCAFGNCAQVSKINPTTKITSRTLAVAFNNLIINMAMADYELDETAASGLITLNQYLYPQIVANSGSYTDLPNKIKVRNPSNNSETVFTQTKQDGNELPTIEDLLAKFAEKKFLAPNGYRGPEKITYLENAEYQMKYFKKKEKKAQETKTESQTQENASTQPTKHQKQHRERKVQPNQVPKTPSAGAKSKPLSRKERNELNALEKRRKELLGH